MQHKTHQTGGENRVANEHVPSNPLSFKPGKRSKVGGRRIELMDASSVVHDGGLSSEITYNYFPGNGTIFGRRPVMESLIDPSDPFLNPIYCHAELGS